VRHTTPRKIPNAYILGFGFPRSGTTYVAETLQQTGYLVGHELNDVKNQGCIGYDVAFTKFPDNLTDVIHVLRDPRLVIPSCVTNFGQGGLGNRKQAGWRLDMKMESELGIQPPEGEYDGTEYCTQLWVEYYKHCIARVEEAKERGVRVHRAWIGSDPWLEPFGTPLNRINHRASYTPLDTIPPEIAPLIPDFTP
jgi:hypothetical protein